MTVAAHQHLVRGRVYLEREQFGLAFEEITKGVVAWPENPVARYYAALAAEGLGDFDRAVEEFRYSIRSGPSHTDARVRLAKLHVAESNYNQAIVILRHDLNNFPSDPDMAVLDLEITWALGGAVAIPQHLAAAISQPGVWQRAVSAIARGTSKHSGPKDAASFLRGSGLDFTDPANALVLRDFVAFLGRGESFDEAVEIARASTAARPEVAVFHSILGLALYLKADAEDDSAAGLAAAKAEVDRALELDPNQAYGLATAGMIARSKNDLEAALDYFMRADASDTSETASLEQAIDILIALERPGDAEENLAKLLEREPYSGPAALKLVQLRVARGAEDEAQTRVLAKHAMRFGGRGPAAVAVLKRSAS